MKRGEVLAARIRGKISEPALDPPISRTKCGQECPPPSTPFPFLPLSSLHPESINDLLRNRLSRRRKICFLPHSLALSPVRKFCRFFSLPVCRPSSLLIGEGEGGGGSRIIRRRESLFLYKSCNTPWLNTSIPSN